MWYTIGNEKRDYRVAALVIPTPTPEWLRRQAKRIVAQSGFLGKWEAACIVFDAQFCVTALAPTGVHHVAKETTLGTVREVLARADLKTTRSMSGWPER